MVLDGPTGTPHRGPGTERAGASGAEVARFSVYVAGGAEASRAVASFRDLCARRLGRGSFAITVIDVLAERQRAEADRIIVAPTVVRESPLPRRRVVGDLTAADAIAAALGLPPEPAKEPTDG
jgi:circadian clock protein KaiB